MCLIVFQTVRIKTNHWWKFCVQYCLCGEKVDSRKMTEKKCAYAYVFQSFRNFVHGNQFLTFCVRQLVQAQEVHFMKIDWKKYAYAYVFDCLPNCAHLNQFLVKILCSLSLVRRIVEFMKNDFSFLTLYWFPSLCVTFGLTEEILKIFRFFRFFFSDFGGNCASDAVNRSSWN